MLQQQSLAGAAKRFVVKLLLPSKNRVTDVTTFRHGHVLPFHFRGDGILSQEKSGRCSARNVMPLLSRTYRKRKSRNLAFSNLPVHFLSKKKKKKRGFCASKALTCFFPALTLDPRVHNSCTLSRYVLPMGGAENSPYMRSSDAAYTGPLIFQACCAVFSSVGRNTCTYATTSIETARIAARTSRERPR